MNTALWVLQGLLAAAFLAAGVNHFQYERARAWVAAVSPRLLRFIAICELLGAAGVILPAVTGVLTWLTPLAAAALGVVMLLALGFHASRREYPNIAFNLILLLLAAGVAYGRLVAVPL
ncbi:MAG: DoxX family protein [Anaerolineales bacterium]